MTTWEPISRVEASPIQDFHQQGIRSPPQTENCSQHPWDSQMTANWIIHHAKQIMNSWKREDIETKYFALAQSILQLESHTV